MTALDDDLVLALLLRESTGDPKAIGVAGEGEVGLLQLMPSTFVEALGRSPAGAGTVADEALTTTMQDPRANLTAGVRYLARAVKAQDGDSYWGLISYRAGIDAAGVWRRTGREPVQLRWPELAATEIEAHVRAVLETYARHRPDVRLVVLPAPGGAGPLVKPVLPAGQC
jgi:soluble lytic murein transglycosylase-like protein